MCHCIYIRYTLSERSKEKIPVTIFFRLVTLEMIFGFMEGNQSFIVKCLLMKENYTFCDKDGRESEMGETNFFGTYLLTSTNKL